MKNKDDNTANIVMDKKTIENHRQAAAHNTEAAKHHLDAVKHYEAGDYEKAAHSSLLAHGHHAITMMPNTTPRARSRLTTGINNRYPAENYPGNVLLRQVYYVVYHLVA